MYYYATYNDVNNLPVEHIFYKKDDGGILSFPNLDTNTGPDRKKYLAWLEEGNTPEPWPDLTE